jgi:Anthrone oxygenase
VVSEIIATFASGIFAGAAVYINFVEQPARLSCGVELAVTEWRPSYKRGTVMQAPLAAIGSLAALVSWWFDRGLPWLVGGLLLLLVIPFTLLVILPTNKRLESRELDLRSEEAGVLLRRWGRLHAVRSLLSVAAFLIFLFFLMGTR